jgi:hypothetical protein
MAEEKQKSLLERLDGAYNSRKNFQDEVDRTRLSAALSYKPGKTKEETEGLKRAAADRIIYNGARAALEDRGYKNLRPGQVFERYEMMTGEDANRLADRLAGTDLSVGQVLQTFKEVDKKVSTGRLASLVQGSSSEDRAKLIMEIAGKLNEYGVGINDKAVDDIIFEIDVSGNPELLFEMYGELNGLRAASENLDNAKKAIKEKYEQTSARTAEQEDEAEERMERSAVAANGGPGLPALEGTALGRAA